MLGVEEAQENPPVPENILTLHFISHKATPARDQSSPTKLWAPYPTSLKQKHVFSTVESNQRFPCSTGGLCAGKQEHTGPFISCSSLFLWHEPKTGRRLRLQLCLMIMPLWDHVLNCPRSLDLEVTATPRIYHSPKPLPFSSYSF